MLATVAERAHLSEPHFPERQYGENMHYLAGMLLVLNDTMYVKHLAQNLAQNKCSLCSSTLAKTKYGTSAINSNMYLPSALQITKPLLHLKPSLHPNPEVGRADISDPILQKKKSSEGFTGSRSNGKKVCVASDPGVRACK